MQDSEQGNREEDPEEKDLVMRCLDCGADFIGESPDELLCRHCARDRGEAFYADPDEEGAEGNSEGAARHGDQSGESHQQLLREDKGYVEATMLKERGDPVTILRDFFAPLGKLIPGQPKRNSWWPTDLVLFFGYYGVERVLGNSLALFLPKLLCFHHDKIYVGRSKLSASRGLTQDWGSKMIKRLLRPWCLKCCKSPTAKNQCGPGQHDWQPPLFFKERVKVKKRQKGYSVTYLRPNMSAFKTLIRMTYESWKADTEDSSPTGEERRARYERRRQQAANARRAKAEAAKEG